MPKFGPEPGDVIESFVDFLPGHIRHFGKDSQRQTLLQRYEGQLDSTLYRYSMLNDLMIYVQDGKYLELILETRDDFIHGRYWSMVALCGMTIEAMCKDIAKIRGEEEAFVKKIQDQDVRNNIEDLREGGYFWLPCTPGMMHRIHDIRIEYVHVKLEKPEEKQMFECLMLTNFVMLAEFGMQPGDKGKVIRVDREYLDRIAKSTGVDIARYW